jgi:predicted dehydrogenase
MNRIGVVGVKGIGQAHCLAIRQSKASTLAAICDIDEGIAAAAGEQHHVPVFTDSDKLFASGEVDSVVVATPCATHAALTRAALDAGLHVYCEKPFTPTSDEAYLVAEQARDAGLTLAVGFQFRFHKGYEAMGEAVADVGPVTRLHVDATNWFRADAYFRASPWRATWEVAGGGVLMNQAVHQLDALIMTVGMPARVDAEVQTARHDIAVEDHAVVHLEYGSGARGVLVASLNEPAGREHFQFQCEAGGVVLTDGYDVKVARHERVGHLIEHSTDEFPPPVPWETVEVPRAASEWFDMLVDAHRDFAAAIEEGRRPITDGDTGILAVELANAIYLSSCTGTSVELPLERGAYPPVFEALTQGRSLRPL